MFINVLLEFCIDYKGWPAESEVVDIEPIDEVQIYEHPQRSLNNSFI